MNLVHGESLSLFSGPEPRLGKIRVGQAKKAWASVSIPTGYLFRASDTDFESIAEAPFPY